MKKVQFSVNSTPKSANSYAKEKYSPTPNIFPNKASLQKKKVYIQHVSLPLTRRSSRSIRPQNRRNARPVRAAIPSQLNFGTCRRCGRHSRLCYSLVELPRRLQHVRRRVQAVISSHCVPESSSVSVVYGVKTRHVDTCRGLRRGGRQREATMHLMVLSGVRMRFHVDQILAVSGYGL